MKSIKQAVCFLLVGLLCTVIIYPLLHELGHSLAAIALGGEIVQLSWLPIPSVLCKMNSPNTSQYVIVGLSGMIFPALLCIFVRSNRFWVWYLMFIMKLTAAWSLVLAGLSVFLFQKGITLPNDDMKMCIRDSINAMDMTKEYGDGANPVILKSEFIMSLCEQLIGGNNLGAVQKSIIDRCTASVYRTYQQNNYTGEVPTLQDFRAELLKQSEPEAQEIALAIELFTDGSLNTFAKKTNVNTDNRLICYDILDLGKQLMPIGMLVVLDSILNRITQNRAKGKNTFIFIDEIYLLFQHEYSANFLFTLWKRVRKYGAYATGITQNVDDLLRCV